MTHLHIPVPAITRGTLVRTHELKSRAREKKVAPKKKKVAPKKKKNSRAKRRKSRQRKKKSSQKKISPAKDKKSRQGKKSMHLRYDVYTGACISIRVCVWHQQGPFAFKVNLFSCTILQLLGVYLVVNNVN